jgi:hypothetical protein
MEIVFFIWNIYLGLLKYVIHSNVTVLFQNVKRKINWLNDHIDTIYFKEKDHQIHLDRLGVCGAWAKTLWYCLFYVTNPCSFSSVISMNKYKSIYL